MPNIFTPEMVTPLILSFVGGSLSALLCIVIWGRGYIKKTVIEQVEKHRTQQPTHHLTENHSLDVIDPAALAQALVNKDISEDTSTEDSDEGMIDTHTDLNKELEQVRSSFESMNLPSLNQTHLSAPVPSKIDIEPELEATIRAPESIPLSVSETEPNPLLDDSEQSLSLEEVQAISDPIPYPNDLPIEDTEDEATVLMHRKPPNS